MFRLYRKTICPRWHSNYKNSFEKKSQNVKPRVSILCINSEKQNHSNDKKQHANKQEKQYWDDPHFHFNNFFRPSLFETAGCLGAVVVYLNYHVKYINSVVFENSHSSCLFSNIVRALPRRHIKNEITPNAVSLPRQHTESERTQYAVSLTKHHTETEKLHSTVYIPSLPAENEIDHLVTFDSVFPEIFIQGSKREKVVEDVDILTENLKVLSEKYSVAIENSVGVRNINKNDKKSFRSFQNAARHGSASGFYNLGLCYQLGKGTKVNLNMAAYCYRKAAMKGHGLASFNLAIFFHKGIGGLPIDTKIAKQLLAEAADKNVSEAQLYFGIISLEEKKWSDAVRILSNLVEKHIPAAQYYLGLCYEYGLGVQKNEKLASELYKKSADQGNKRAVDKLKNSKKAYSNNSHSFSKTDGYKKAESNSLHPSMSVPELGTVVKKSNGNLLKFPILSYLNLFTPLVIVNNTTQVKDNCYSNEKLAKECSSTYFSFKPLPAVVMEVKSQL